MDVDAIKTAIIEASEAGIYPKLAPQGSSGTYFVYDRHLSEIGVFKPRDEEPYAPWNPRCIKFLHRLLFPCCFGRPFLIPNHGYLAEVGAYIVDRQSFGFGIVPPTRVMELRSPTFNNPRGDVKRKKGSFQVFVHGYVDASEKLNEWMTRGLENTLTAEQDRQFTREFHKLCMLDYLIRNTDRRPDNWLISPDHDENGNETECLRIAAIDNGLSFPVEHPELTSLFRHFPFDWANLQPWASKPWDADLRREVLTTMTPAFLHRLIKDLSDLFKLGDRDTWRFHPDQMQVLRGQAWNLRKSLLAEHGSPQELTQRVPVLLKSRYRGEPPSDAPWEECFRPKKSERGGWLGACFPSPEHSGDDAAGLVGSTTSGTRMLTDADFAPLCSLLFGDGTGINSTACRFVCFFVRPRGRFAPLILCQWSRMWGVHAPSRP